MAFTHSLSALDLKLEIDEVEALIQWHRDNQCREADREEYQLAANSKQRADQLQEDLTKHRKMLTAARRSPHASETAEGE